MKQYLFLLGHSPQISIVELQSFFPEIELITRHIALFKTQDLSFSPEEFIKKLGGTVKICELVSEVNDFTISEFNTFFDLEKFNLLNIFSCDNEADNAIYLNLLKQIKEQFKSKGMNLRYLNKISTLGASGVVFKKEKILEIMVCKNNNGVRMVGKVVGVQNFEEWTERDFGRPKSDAKSGMLPPKVARMLVNIALNLNTSEYNTLCDPFCGMGTIICEAGVLGINSVASDISNKAVESTRINVEWLKKKHPEYSFNVEYHVNDATKLSNIISSSKIGMIVTETFLGDTKIARDFKNNRDIEQVKNNIKNTIKGLEKLYTGCLKNWSNVINKDGVIILIIPEYNLNGHKFIVKNIVDICETYGYTIQQGPLSYSKRDQLVSRSIYILKRK